MRFDQAKQTKAKNLRGAFSILGISCPRIQAAAKTPTRGRPQSVTSAVLAKLEIAYRFGCTDREACIFAGIHPATLYRFSEHNSDFCEQKLAWRDLPVLLARMTMINAIAGGDARAAQWYLERRCSIEFSHRDSPELNEVILTPEEIERAAWGEFQTSR